MDLHKVVGKRHHSNDQRVHGDADHNDSSVEFEQRLVLLQTALDQLAPDKVQEVDVQAEIHEEIDDLLDPVPDLVQADPCRADFHASGDPDDVDADVDDGNGNQK